MYENKTEFLETLKNHEKFLENLTHYFLIKRKIYLNSSVNISDVGLTSMICKSISRMPVGGAPTPQCPPLGL